MILSIDIGTSRIRVLLFSLDGELLYERSRMTPAETPFDGAAEIDCATLWREVADVIATLTPSVRAVSALGSHRAARHGVPWAGWRATCQGDAVVRYARPRGSGGIAWRLRPWLLRNLRTANGA